MKNIFSLGELFEQVQLQNIFSDGKTFVDCIPRFELSIIHNSYENQKHEAGFKLSEFISKNFSVPETPGTGYISVKGSPIKEHIEILWGELTRNAYDEESSLIPLPYPYIVPGGRFREMFYWDSYFTMLGLKVSDRTDMILNMVNNFSHLIDKFGYIPNGNRSYFLGRSQPPFYASMLKLLSSPEDKQGEGFIIQYLPQLEKEYNFWMRGSEQLNDKTISVSRVCIMPDKSILNHYWDDNDTPRPESYAEDTELANHVGEKNKLFRNIRAACESGWDFSSRWYKKDNDISTTHTTEIIPVDLNCLLFNLEQTIAEAYKLKMDHAAFKNYKSKAEKRQIALNKYCWNEEQNFYFDYDFVDGKQKKSLTLAATYPLYFKMATNEQAGYVAKALEKYFLSPGGLLTTTITTGQQWDNPNGWAPLQYISIQGLKNYGHDKLANEIENRWLSLNERVYDKTGRMMEKYNVVSTELDAGGGEYPSQDGFGWTNGVYLHLKSKINNV